MCQGFCPIVAGLRCCGEMIVAGLVAQSQLGNGLHQASQTLPAQQMMEEDHAALQAVNRFHFIIPTAAGPSDKLGHAVKHPQSAGEFQRRNITRQAVKNASQAGAFGGVTFVLQKPMQKIG